MSAHAALAAQLAQGCRELELDVSAADQGRLLGYLDLLARWNATYNLTAVREPAAMLAQHLLDCLAVIAPLRRWRSEHLVTRLLDVGSGAGLPGCVIALLEPDVEVTCVDSVGKKAAFIRHAAGHLQLHNLRAEHARVETLRGGWDVIASRAFADLALSVSLTRSLLNSGGAWLAMKAKLPNDELTQLPAWADAFHVEQLRVPQLAAERCLVWLRDIERPSRG
ncbi:16S rRNA (guanine(527)-N(7))-methyltransferase RsmG [Piscinibacter koreensis]|uniref:Ribosomal RNA small subunit methyltransferase G n=1 Tax=Piscinibacter koreensis TaxID=2742824 RepID=A0A7Y6NJN8_9BURK|nr:16S rRNA (guanine(527)-N(7))-methyltransferase RsmG [Schlegelella koreensis]NUZ04349.1 16S rRNA (guanine(527)-N(7))-methyltransferase RsmG [Schlegelella koreensis]